MRNLIRKIYKHIPCKAPIFKLLRLMGLKFPKIHQHLHFKGLIRIQSENRKYFKMVHYGYELENEIFWNGLYNGWEKQSFRLWSKLSKEANTIVDIGANTGVYALIAASLNPGARVIAFEPVERVFQKLEKNIQINKFNIEAIQKAVSDKDGTAIIYDTSAEHTYSVTVNKNRLGTDEGAFETVVNIIRLDTYCQSNNVSKIDLIKIDVETHEPEVLQGYGALLANHRPTILIEILSDEIGEQIEKIVSNLDYMYFNIDEQNVIQQVKSIKKSMYYNYLLCSMQTAEKLMLI